MPTALIVEDEPEANRLLSLLVQTSQVSNRKRLDRPASDQPAGWHDARRHLSRPDAARHQRLRAVPADQGDGGRQRFCR